MPNPPIEIVSEEEFWGVDKEFTEVFDQEESDFDHDTQCTRYDEMYDILVEELRSVGTHDEGSGSNRADFVTSRYVDPHRVIVVVSNTQSVLSTGALLAAHRAITRIDRRFFIIFDTESYFGVHPDGRVIAYSDHENIKDLLEHIRATRS